MAGTTCPHRSRGPREPADPQALLQTALQCPPACLRSWQLCQPLWEHQCPDFTLWFPWVSPKSNVFHLEQMSLTDRATSCLG